MTDGGVGRQTNGSEELANGTSLDWRDVEANLGSSSTKARIAQLNTIRDAVSSEGT